VAGGSAVDPDFHLGDGVARESGGRARPVPGSTPSRPKIIGGNMFEQLRKRAAAGLFGIFELAA